jgi:hypothetical protein
MNYEIQGRSICELCNRELLEFLSFHHLIPRALHGKKRYKKKYTREELNRGLDICKDCHSGIHDLLTEKQLGETYNTKEQLLAHEGIAKHVAWVKKQK